MRTRNTEQAGDSLRINYMACGRPARSTAAARGVGRTAPSRRRRLPCTGDGVRGPRQPLQGDRPRSGPQFQRCRPVQETVRPVRVIVIDALAEEAVSVILEVHQQVTVLLRHALPRGMSGDPGQVRAASAATSAPPVQRQPAWVRFSARAGSGPVDAQSARTTLTQDPSRSRRPGRSCGPAGSARPSATPRRARSAGDR